MAREQRHRAYGLQPENAYLRYNVDASQPSPSTSTPTSDQQPLTPASTDDARVQPCVFEHASDYDAPQTLVGSQTNAALDGETRTNTNENVALNENATLNENENAIKKFDRCDCDVNGKLTLCAIDFGMGASMNSPEFFVPTVQQLGGTPQFMAPRMVDNILSHYAHQAEIEAERDLARVQAQEEAMRSAEQAEGAPSNGSGMSVDETLRLSEAVNLNPLANSVIQQDAALDGSGEQEHYDQDCSMSANEASSDNESNNQQYDDEALRLRGYDNHYEYPQGQGEDLDASNEDASGAQYKYNQCDQQMEHAYTTQCSAINKPLQSHTQFFESYLDDQKYADDQEDVAMQMAEGSFEQQNAMNTNEWKEPHSQVHTSRRWRE